MIKGKYNLSLPVEVNVDVCDINYETMDEYSDVIHNNNTRDFHARRLEKLITDALRQLSLAGFEGVEVRVGRPVVHVTLDEENRRLHDEQSRSEHEAAMEEIDRVRKLGKDLGIEHTVWSISEHTHGLFMDDVAFDHKYVIFCYSSGWDDARPLFSEGYTRPTWRDVWLAADDLVRRSNDKHHIFLETARVHAEADGALIVEVDFGS